MGETAIEKEACKKIRDVLGVDNIKLKAQGRRGWPDRLFWIPGGRPLLIEFKVPGEKPTPMQAHVHQFLTSNGYQVETHDTVIGAFRAVAQALGARPRPEKGR